MLSSKVIINGSFIDYILKGLTYFLKELNIFTQVQIQELYFLFYCFSLLNFGGWEGSFQYSNDLMMICPPSREKFQSTADPVEFFLHPSKTLAYFPVLF